VRLKDGEEFFERASGVADGVEFRRSHWRSCSTWTRPASGAANL
jgi:hypothetical protein